MTQARATSTVPRALIGSSPDGSVLRSHAYELACADLQDANRLRLNTTTPGFVALTRTTGDEAS